MPDIVDAPGQAAMYGLDPQRLAPFFQPAVQRIEIREGGHHLPHPAASIADVLFDLPLLPSGGRVAEVGFEYVVACHRHEARIHVALLADAHTVHRRAHIVVDPAGRHAFEDPERVPVRVEQHLMCLQQIRPDQKRAAMRQLDVCDLQLGPFAPDDRVIFAPIELEGLARLEHQRHECPAIRRALRPLPVRFPGADKG